MTVIANEMAHVGAGRLADVKVSIQKPAAEVSEVHTRLLKCALCIEESRAYWARAAEAEVHDPSTLAATAFEQSWFGAKSMPWVSVLISNMRARFDAYPHALQALAAWRNMTPDVRRLVCHWHLQLTDPMYRAFTGEYLVKRRLAFKPQVDRHTVIRWVEDQGPGRWTVSTRTQFGTRLLSCALDAGLTKGRRDPRELAYPRVSDQALTYLLYLLRAVGFKGSLVQNPYLASVGLEGALLADRLRTLDAIRYARLGDVYDFEWRYAGLTEWVASTSGRAVPSHAVDQGAAG